MFWEILQAIVIGLIVLFMVGGCTALGWGFITISRHWAKMDREDAKRNEIRDYWRKLDG